MTMMQSENILLENCIKYVNKQLQPHIRGLQYLHINTASFLLEGLSPLEKAFTLEHMKKFKLEVKSCTSDERAYIFAYTKHLYSENIVRIECNFKTIILLGNSSNIDAVAVRWLR